MKLIFLKQICLSLYGMMFWRGITMPAITVERHFHFAYGYSLNNISYLVWNNMNHCSPCGPSPWWELECCDTYDTWNKHCRFKL